MSDTCGEPLRRSDGLCEYQAKHPDGKCGVHSEHGENPHRPKQVSEPLIREFLERERQAAGRKNTTFRNRVTGCTAFEEWLSTEGKGPLDVGPLSIQYFVDWLISPTGRAVSDGTAQTYVQNVSTFYEWLVKKHKEDGEGVEENPVHDADFTDRLTAPNTTEREKVLGMKDSRFALSKPEMKTMIEHAQSPDVFRSQLILKLLAQTGCRPKELTEILVDDVRNGRETELWENNRIRIRATKTERYTSVESGVRTVRYNDGLKFYLDRWLDDGYRDSYNGAKDSAYIFPTNTKDHISTSVVETIVDDAAVAAGMQEIIYFDSIGRKRRKITPYAFRHGFGTYMANKGCPPSKLANLMGSDVNTIMKYYVSHNEKELDGMTDIIPDI